MMWHIRRVLSRIARRMNMRFTTYHPYGLAWSEEYGWGGWFELFGQCVAFAGYVNAKDYEAGERPKLVFMHEL